MHFFFETFIFQKIFTIQVFIAGIAHFLNSINVLHGKFRSFGTSKFQLILGEMGFVMMVPMFTFFLFSLGLFFGLFVFLMICKRN